MFLPIALAGCQLVQLNRGRVSPPHEDARLCDVLSELPYEVGMQAH
jgi:hypothetical protein